MKFLALLAALQTIAILFLAVKLVEFERRVDAITMPERTSGMAAAEPAVSPDQSVQHLTPNQLRSLLREELDAYLSDGAADDQKTDSHDPATVADADDGHRLESVSRRIDYYKSTGSISAIEMNQLQMDIAALDPPARQRMLNQLTKAMTAGQIDGDL